MRPDPTSLPSLEGCRAVHSSWIRFHKSWDHPTSPAVYQLEGELPDRSAGVTNCIVHHILIKLLLIIFSSFYIPLNSLSQLTNVAFCFPSVFSPIPGEGSVGKQVCGVYLPAKSNYNV